MTTDPWPLLSKNDMLEAIVQAKVEDGDSDSPEAARSFLQMVLDKRHDDVVAARQALLDAPQVACDVPMEKGVLYNLRYMHEPRLRYGMLYLGTEFVRVGRWVPNEEERDEVALVFARFGQKPSMAFAKTERMRPEFIASIHRAEPNAAQERFITDWRRRWGAEHGLDT